jgi:hypothetical protein
MKLARYRRKLKELRGRLPQRIDETRLAEKFPISLDDSSSILLHQEVHKYNSLLLFLEKHLEALATIVAGEQLPTDETNAEL